jgi:hypothetical protein
MIKEPIMAKKRKRNTELKVKDQTIVMEPPPKGRPTKYEESFHPDDFIRLSKEGKSLTQIALEWDVHRDSIYEWKNLYPIFSDAIKKGRLFAEAWYMNVGQQMMFMSPQNFNTGIFVWMTKNMFNWSDKLDTKHSGEIGMKESKGETLKKMFKDEKSRALALELAERLNQSEDDLQ